MVYFFFNKLSNIDLWEGKNKNNVITQHIQAHSTKVVYILLTRLPAVRNVRTFRRNEGL